METLAESSANQLMETTSPALLLLTEELKPSMQAYGADKPNQHHAHEEEEELKPSEGLASSGDPRIHTALRTSSTFMKKKVKKVKKKKKMMMPTTLPVRRNEWSRHVNMTSERLRKFRMRRNGLFRKARELSNLCNAEVAAIVVSPSGEVSEFASSSMSHVLKRYHSFQPQMRSNNVLLHGVKNSKRKANMSTIVLKEMQHLKRFSKNISSSINVVQSIESIITQTLTKIHKRKMEILEVEIRNETQKLAQVMSAKQSA